MASQSIDTCVSGPGRQPVWKGCGAVADGWGWGWRRGWEREGEARPREGGGAAGRKVVVESTCCRQWGLPAFLRTSCAALTSISPSRSSSPVLLLGRAQHLLHSFGAHTYAQKCHLCFNFFFTRSRFQGPCLPVSSLPLQSQSGYSGGVGFLLGVSYSPSCCNFALSPQSSTRDSSGLRT